MTSPYAQAARLYRAAGWEGVLPLPYKRKEPVPVGYTGRDGVMPKGPDVEAWLLTEAPRNVALRLPRNVIGLDVDAYDGRPGAATLDALTAKLGALPDTWISSSRDDGESGIRLFRLPENVSSDQWPNVAGPGIDIIRHAHRYAVVWPSMHPEGHKYIWHDPNGAGVPVPVVNELAELPAMWCEHIAGLRTIAPPAVTQSNDPFAEVRAFTVEQARAHVRPFTRALQQAKDGEINTRLNDAAKVLSHFGEEFWPRGEAERALRGALARTEYDGKTWKAETTIESAYRSAQDDWKAVLRPETAVDGLTGTPEGEDTGIPIAVDWRALWDDDTEEEWILEPLLPARRGIALFSEPKVGKSLLMLEIAAAIATGREVLSATPTQRHVLYVDLENDPRGDTRERLKAMGYKPDDLDQLHLLSFPSLPALDRQAGGDLLIETAIHYQAELVIIDTVSRTVSGEENSNDTWLAFYRHTGFKLKQAGIAYCRLDHTGKDASKGQRGGSAKSGDVDAVWRLAAVTKGETYRLTCEDSRFPIAEDDRTLNLAREEFPLRHRLDGKGRKAGFEQRVDAVMRALMRLTVPHDATNKECADALRADGFKVENVVLAEAVRRRKSPIPRSANGAERVPEDGHSADHRNAAERAPWEDE